MNKEFISAIEELEKEKSISKEVLMETIELALVSAYKKNYGTAQNVRVSIDRDTGDIAVLMKKEIVDDDEFESDILQIPLSEAQEIDRRYETGDAIEFSVMPKEFGRIAAQTAKQVVVQRIREAERGMVYDEFSTREGEVVTGTIQRKSGNTIFVSLGKAEGILTATEQVSEERYEIGDRIKLFIMDVKKAAKGPQVFLSRSHPGLVKGLFELEVPEIQDDIVEIRSIAREAGSRTKLAVASLDEDVDPVGACVGTHGSRVQAVVDELNGEKIDIITWSDDPVVLINNVLSPADVEEVIIEDEEDRIATAIVPDYQLSLAIGKLGQNVRLAAKVSGWKIDIQSHYQYYESNEDDFDEETEFVDDIPEPQDDGETADADPADEVSEDDGAAAAAEDAEDSSDEEAGEPDNGAAADEDDNPDAEDEPDADDGDAGVIPETEPESAEAPEPADDEAAADDEADGLPEDAAQDEEAEVMVVEPEEE